MTDSIQKLAAIPSGDRSRMPCNQPSRNPDVSGDANAHLKRKVIGRNPGNRAIMLGGSWCATLVYLIVHPNGECRFKKENEMGMS